MKRRTLTQLGETELEVLQHVWAFGEASVAEVHEKILETRKVAYTTIMTVMRKLAEKGYLTFKKEGMSYRYAPAQSQEHVQQHLLDDFLNTVFQGSPARLVQTLVAGQQLTEAQQSELRKLIDGLEDDDADNA